MRFRSIKREIRAIPINDPILRMQPGNRPADEETLLGRGIWVQYRDANEVICLCNGYDDQEWPGELIAGRVGMYGPDRRALAFERLPARANSAAFDALSARIPEIEDDQPADPVTGDPGQSGRTLTPRERFERRLTRIAGDG